MMPDGITETDMQGMSLKGRQEMPRFMVWVSQYDHFGALHTVARDRMEAWSHFISAVNDAERRWSYDEEVKRRVLNGLDILIVDEVDHAEAFEHWSHDGYFLYPRGYTYSYDY